MSEYDESSEDEKSMRQDETGAGLKSGNMDGQKDGEAERKLQVKKGDFGEGKVWKLILSQALPLTLAQFVQVLYNIVDRAYIGHLPGDSAGTALTGLGITFPVITLIAAFTNLFATGGAPLCSIARGKGDQERAERLLGTTLTMQIITGIVLAVILFFTKKPILYLFGASDSTYYYAGQYLDIYLLGTVFLMVGTGMNGFISLQGFPKMGMMTTVIGAVLNLVLDPVFIFGLDMGVKGAAIATVISQAVSALWVLRFLLGDKVSLKLGFKTMKPEFKMLGEIVGLGMAGFIMAATNCAVQAVCNATLSIYGGDIYVGVMTILNSVREMIGLPVNGITSGSQPVLGYNYGAGKPHRVLKGIRFTSAVGVGYTSLMWLLVILFPRFFLRIFTSDDLLVQHGQEALIIYFMGFFMMSLQFAGQSVFVALGMSKHAVFFSLLRKAVIVIPLTLFLPHVAGLGVNGVFWAEPVSNFIGGLACFVTMYFAVYRKLKKEIVCS